MSADTRKYDLYVGGVRVDVYPVGLREYLPALTRFATVRHPAMRGHRWEALRGTGRRLLRGTADWLTGRNPTWLHGYHAEPASVAGPIRVHDALRHRMDAAPGDSRPSDPRERRPAMTDIQSRLVEHARRELALIGEEQSTIDGLVSVVGAFAECGHSGGSAPYAIAYLERLLRFEPLTPITNDPAEWTDQSEISGHPWWQSVRDSRAMSHDGGKTYWLVTDNSSGDTPTYTAADSVTNEQHASETKP